MVIGPILFNTDNNNPNNSLSDNNIGIRINMESNYILLEEIGWNKPNVNFIERDFFKILRYR